MNNKSKKMVSSYIRSAIAAILAVISTGNYAPDDLLKAALAALLPPLIRWVNPNDPTFGRGSNN